MIYDVKDILRSPFCYVALRASLRLFVVLDLTISYLTPFTVALGFENPKYLAQHQLALLI